MKVDRAKNEATVRFGNYTATVTAADMGWSTRQPKTNSRPAISLSLKSRKSTRRDRRLKVELSQVPGSAGRDDDAQCQDRRRSSP